MNDSSDRAQDPSDDELHALLTSHGGPAGPQLDRMWASVEEQVGAQLEESGPSPAVRRSSGLSNTLAAVCAAGALAAFVWLPASSSDEFAVKGALPVDAAGNAQVFIQLSCDSLCGVGAPVFVRLRVRKPGAYALQLRDAEGIREIWRSSHPLEAGETAVPLELRFTDDDARAGAQLIVVDDDRRVVGRRQVPLS